MILRFFSICFTAFWCWLFYDGPVRIRMIFQKCGGVFVKFGQMLALRSDIISVPLAFELLQLLESLPSVSTKKIRDIIEEELGQPVESIFSWFEETPLSTASFAQVHRAQLPDGRLVIIKVQKPGIDRLVATDLNILRFGAWLADAFGPRRPIPMKKVYQEFAEWTLRELDYTLEAQSINLFRDQNKLSWVKVPAVVQELTTKKILVEEFIDGMSLAQRVKLPYHESNPVLAKALLEAISHQYFLNGLFHGDPHGGNILLDQDGLINYIDFGMTGTTTKLHRQIMAQFIYHAFRNDYEAAMHAFLHLGFSQRIKKDAADLAGEKQLAEILGSGVHMVTDIVTKQFAHNMQAWHNAVNDPSAGFSNKSAAASFLAFLSFANRYRINLEREIILFIKALVAVDAMSLQLDPRFNMIDTMNEIFSRPDYKWLFAKPAGSLVPARPAKPTHDPEKIARLKDYYMDWATELLNMHEEDFSKLLKFAI